MAQQELEERAAREFLIYLRSPTMCQGEEQVLAAQVGIGRWHEWQYATDYGQAPPPKAFADAGQAFAYLYNELQCRDGLMMYRYGNLLRLDGSYDSAIRIMEASLPGIHENYPEFESGVEAALGHACVGSGRHDAAIAHYERALELDPLDGGTRLDLATQLFELGDKAGARAHAERALEVPLSEIGQRVAVDLISRTQ